MLKLALTLVLIAIQAYESLGKSPNITAVESGLLGGSRGTTQACQTTKKTLEQLQIYVLMVMVFIQT